MKLPKAAWYLLSIVALFALWAWKTGYLWPEPSLDPNPLALARGELVLKQRCWHCHEAVPLAQRVAGWTPEYAYDALGHLPDLRPAMPPFRGTDQERADLAIYLWSIGKNAQPLAAEEPEGEWQPPSFEPPPAQDAARPPEPPAAARPDVR